jgi:hypothetical protein
LGLRNKQQQRHVKDVCVPLTTDIMIAGFVQSLHKILDSLSLLNLTFSFSHRQHMYDTAAASNVGVLPRHNFTSRNFIHLSQQLLLCRIIHASTTAMEHTVV